MLGGYDPAKYKVERFFAPAPDGAQVPVTLVYRKDLRKPTGNPTLIQAYGAYCISTSPDFPAHQLSLIDRGDEC